ncbi:HesB/YadR/YfhF family protein [Staphylococcus auricularis]|uniref:HesB/YadR/YfhF-family protein n=1 Tax=Staphylococcus auricularis TaxID=29379 RepID=A0ABX5IE93_9STAP|nr:HesB/YadR/YfhF family protein [Staphylococcus auricularis]MCE5037994.1 HesB/YadR/YfhF family protein [Staphylococcus auricularis]MEB6569487.1 HesB/YadR/YfhF family protein [Staphylococcus auricularis]PTH18236.1 hypothetical protein BU607_05855 [Staphylococcus auricularis]PTH24980.1 hypothetical protein BU608_09080 [Staphylococcus auricularis]
MKIDISSEAVNWFKEELDLPQEQKVLVFYVRYGGEFQLKQGFSPAFSVEDKQDIEIGYENVIEGLTVAVGEKDLWYFEDDELYIDIDNGKDEIAYSTK